MELNKIHVGLGTLAAIAVFLWQAIPPAYTYFDRYHVEKIKNITASDHILLAATAKQLEVAVTQNSLVSLRKEEYMLRESIRTRGADQYTISRLEKVEAEIAELEERLRELR